MDANLTIILIAAIVTPVLAGAISYLLVLSVQRLIFSKDEPDKSGKSMNLMDFDSGFVIKPTGLVILLYELTSCRGHARSAVPGSAGILPA